jgi:hypothetical protein
MMQPSGGGGTIAFMQAESDPKGQEAYAQLIADQFRDEQARKESLDRRAISVVTASGWLITAIAAAAGLITRGPATWIRSNLSFRR